MSQQFIIPSESSQSDVSGVSKWVTRMIKIWPWFLASLFATLLLATMYLLYAHPKYQAAAAIMVKDDKKGAEMMDNSVLKEMGLGGNNKLVENEVEVLKSPDLLEETVKRLKLYIEISKKGKIKDSYVFGSEIPFIVDILNTKGLEAIGKNNLDALYWKISLRGNEINFKSKTGNTAELLKFNQIYSSDSIFFSFTRNPSYVQDPSDSEQTTFTIKLIPISVAIINYGNVLSIDQATKLATVIDLEISDKNEAKATAILNTLINVYIQTGLEDKNRVTDSTINFLNERLNIVADQLQNAEGNVQKFKSKNKVTDLSVDEQQYLTLAQQVDIEKAQSETQMNLVVALEQNLEKNQNDPQLVPSTLGLAEPSLAQLIEQHNQLILQKERIQQKAGPQNPLLLDLQQQIQEIRIKLLSNVRNLRQASAMSLKYSSDKDNKLAGRIQNVPVLEKQLIQITRDKTVQEQIYTFLLQKREESAITRASNVEDSRTIAAPRSLGQKWPKKSLIFALAIILGLFIPISFVYVKDSLHNKVGDLEQLTKSSDLPILGAISHIKKIKTPIVVNLKSRSIVSEQVRHIRTALSFTSKGKEVKTILATSYQPGDGKSFVTLNLAASYALLDKKTIILEFDLRKPHITQSLNIENKEGLSSLLSGKSSLNDLILEIEGFNGNLFLLPSGYLPPNPAELIAGPYMPGLMKQLETKFDYIIIDTPPFSLVTDAALLEQYANITMVILRQDFTSMDVYDQLKRFAARQSASSIYLVLNDIGKATRYQNGYGANYGNGYYNDEK